MPPSLSSATSLIIGFVSLRADQTIEQIEQSDDPIEPTRFFFSLFINLADSRAETKRKRNRTRGHGCHRVGNWKDVLSISIVHHPAVPARVRDPVSGINNTQQDYYQQRLVREMVRRDKIQIDR